MIHTGYADSDLILIITIDHNKRICTYEILDTVLKSPVLLATIVPLESLSIQVMTSLGAIIRFSDKEILLSIYFVFSFADWVGISIFNLTFSSTSTFMLLN